MVSYNTSVHLSTIKVITSLSEIHLKRSGHPNYAMYNYTIEGVCIKSGKGSLVSRYFPPMKSKVQLTAAHHTLALELSTNR